MFETRKPTIHFRARRGRSSCGRAVSPAFLTSSIRHTTCLNCRELHRRRH